MRKPWLVLSLAGSLVAAPLAAQATADQARLSLGIAAGVAAGTNLWTINGQEIFDGAFLVDTLRLTRRIRGRALSVVFHGTYFPGEHWGFTGEAMLLGLGLEDDCEITGASGSPRNTQICNSIQQHTSASSAVALSLGAMYRIWSRKVISPYLRTHVGFAISQNSTIQVDAEAITSDPNEPTLITVYNDPGSRQLSPVVGFGIGFTAAVGHGYQLRWEARDNMVYIPRVTGTTSGAPNLEPPHDRAFRHVFSVTVGFDIVLERRRGRRY